MARRDEIMAGEKAISQNANMTLLERNLNQQIDDYARKYEKVCREKEEILGLNQDLIYEIKDLYSKLKLSFNQRQSLSFNQRQPLSFNQRQSN